MAISTYSIRGTEELPVGEGKDILGRMQDIYNQISSITLSYWNQASIDERFYAGDQSLWNEIYSNIPSYRRKQFNFNKIRRIINMVSGHQRKNRKSIICLPQEGSDQETADQFTKTLMWANSQANTYNILSEAFLGACVSGMNLLSVWMDYRDDPISGDIRIDNYGYNGFLMDPFFHKHDLSDCNYIWTRKFLSKRQIASLIPSRADEIMRMTNSVSYRDQKFVFLPQNYNYPIKDLLGYDEFWYLDSRDATVLIDPETEEMIEWKGKEDNLKYFLMLNPQIKKKVIQKQTVKLAVVVNGIEVMYNGANPMGIDRYPFVPVLGYYRPELPYHEWRIQGITRSLRDPQFILNRRQQILLDVLESQINSGLKVMEDSLVDDRDAFKQGQGQALFIKKTAPMGMGSVEKIPPAAIPTAMFDVIGQMDKNLMDISGINEELLGSAEDDKAGILSMLRQGAGLTTLQILFDQLDFAHKALGMIEMDLIQANFTPAKIKRITEHEATDQFFNKNFKKYDCQVVEGTDMPTQRMMAFKQALYLRELGIPIPTEYLLEMSTMQNKTEIIKKIVEQEQQQAQQAQQAQMLQAQELKARTDLAEARAYADQGLGIERISRINENQSMAIERRAAAIKDLDMSNLEKIKAAKELKGMDITHLKELLNVIDQLKAGEMEEIKNLEQPAPVIPPPQQNIPTQQQAGQL